MINLKMSKKELEKKSAPGPINADTPEYPYGTRISFDEEQIVKMNVLQDIDVDTAVFIKAKGKVTSVSENSTAGGKDRRRVEIQIEEIDVRDSTDFNSGFNQDKED